MKINYSFVIFISIFLMLYGSLHLYFYRKVIKVFDLSLMPKILFIAVLCILLLSPIIMKVMENSSSNEELTAVVTYIGYLWVGIIFILFVFNLTVDLYRLVIYVSSHIFDTSLIKLIPDRRITLLVIISLTALINLYGLYEAGQLKTEKITLQTTKLPAGIERLRIVQVTDIHFSRITGLKMARKIADIVSDLNPDILVSTGDLIDDGLREVDQVQKQFKSINTKYGKYAATGNHEFFMGITLSSRFTEGCGFRLLRNESIEVNDFINIAGVDDPAVKRIGLFQVMAESKIIDGFSPEKINILLKHQPRIEADSIGKFDIQLSGHTHNGQIFPFNFLVGLVFKYMSGIYDLGKDSYLYVSRGTGTWGPPVRFLSPPEITVIDIYQK